MAKLKPNQFILSGHLITELPILYETEMVRAILADRKTNTRRTKGLSLNISGKPKEHWTYTECSTGYDTKGNDVWMATVKHIPTGRTHADDCPYGKPGDLLWVRETWANLNGDFPDADPFLVFKSDMEHPNQYGPVTWKPSIHMHKSASRIWLMVEDIRVERLQDISEADAIAEGIEPIDQHGVKVWKIYDGYHTVTSKPRVSFWSLWTAINGNESWKSNPWVWVIKFRVLSKTGRPSDAVILENYLEVTGKEVSNA